MDAALAAVGLAVVGLLPAPSAVDFSAPPVLAAWLELSGRYGAWWVDGLSLVLGATGAAVLWSGIAGVPPDWIDEA